MLPVAPFMFGEYNKSERLQDPLLTPHKEDITMHGRARPSLLGLLLCGIVIHGAMVWAGEGRGFASPPAPTAMYEYCYGTQPKQQLPDESMVPDAVFYSGVFTLMSNDQMRVSNAFQAFLEEHHQFHADPSLAQPISCFSSKIQAEVQEERDRSLRRAQKFSYLQTVVDTDWMYSAP